MISHIRAHQLKFPCRFAHDVVREGDRALVASTGDGAIIVLRLPSMQHLETHQLFSSKAHVNALAPLGNGSVWCLLHNHGKASLMQLCMLLVKSTPLIYHLPACNLHLRRDHCQMWERKWGKKRWAAASDTLVCCLQSDIVLVDLEHGTEESRLRSIGTHAHGLVLWRDKVVTLDSEEGTVGVLQPSSGSMDIIWKVSLPDYALSVPRNRM